MPAVGSAIAVAAFAAASAGAVAAAPSSRFLKSIEFQELAAASGTWRHDALASDRVRIGHGKDIREYDIEYHVLQRSGDENGKGVFGQQIDENANDVKCASEIEWELGDTECYGRVGEKKISNNADFSSLLPVGDYVYSISHFEAPPPAISYLTKMRQKDDGHLEVISTERIYNAAATEAHDGERVGFFFDASRLELSVQDFLHYRNAVPASSCTVRALERADHEGATIYRAMDWSPLGGLWTPCAGSVTPWNTHFGSEEYEPDARELADLVKEDPEGEGWKDISKYLEQVTGYFNMPFDSTNADVAEVMYAYKYGYPWQAKVNEDGSFEVAKHYSMGRQAYELPLVMPDKKTVYMTDDGTNVMLSKYVADEAGKLECGTLYGAKFTQKEQTQAAWKTTWGGEFDIEWIQLGPKACDDDFKDHLKADFYDMFDAEAPDEETGECPEGYTSINTSAGHECLRLKDGKDKLASRFEKRRYAAMKGCTTEFSKWEGITYDPKRNVLYTAMSDVRYGMEDFGEKGFASSEYDMGGPNHIRVEYNPCGCVYTLELDEDYSAYNMYALICGSTEGDVDNYNICAKDGIANPDNVAYVTGHDGLIIGEDSTDGHQNDVLWYYSFKNHTLTRFMSTPFGAETTSPYWYPNVNGWAYIMAVVQHPYSESDEDRIDEHLASGDRSWVGYLGPFKAREDSDGIKDLYGLSD